MSLALFLLCVSCFVATQALNWRVQNKAEAKLCTLESVEPSQAALIFGAYVYPDGTPCLVLQDRLDRGLELYQRGAVGKLLVTGDHGRADYDEVNAMRCYLENRGVPRQDIFCDHAGFDTYDSIYRARDIFKAESLVLVTQSFHLKRALFVADSLGVNAQGIASDQRAIPEIRSLERRELLANYKALFDTTRRRDPKFLGVEIPLSGSSKVSHDF